MTIGPMRAHSMPLLAGYPSDGCCSRVNGNQKSLKLDAVISLAGPTD